MVEVKKYHLPPTPLMPNSPYPLLHYPGLLSSKETRTTTHVYDLLTRNGWQTQWIFRYGPTQQSHYHSRAHECMVVLTGSATIRFGVADTVDDLEENTHGSGREAGGVEVAANPGDVFVLPAGTAHKTFDTVDSAFKLLTPGEGHGVEGEDQREVLRGIQLDGFTMMGAYPVGGREWDFAVGGEDRGRYERVWEVPRPEKDPVLGEGAEGLCGTWR